MKKIFITLILVLSNLTLGLANSQAVDNCGAGGTLPTSFDYLNAPADPTSAAAFAGTKKLGQLTVNNSTTSAYFYVSPFVGDGLLAGELETYFFFWSSDGGSNWKCTRAYASATSVELQPNQDYVAIVVVQARTGKGISTITKFSTKKAEKQMCAAGKVTLSVNYDSRLKQYDLRLVANNLNPEEKSLQYIMEVSTDNWKTKAVFKNAISLYNPFKFLPPIKQGVTHQFRLIPDASNIYVDPNGLVLKYTTNGCSPLVASASTTDNRSECEKNPGLDKCQYTVVPGDNAEVTSTESPKVGTVLQNQTITCINGKLTKKVTAVNPKCPAGYKVKK
jgi:hypothetical protein